MNQKNREVAGYQVYMEPVYETNRTPLEVEYELKAYQLEVKRERFQNSEILGRIRDFEFNAKQKLRLLRDELQQAKMNALTPEMRELTEKLRDLKQQVRHTEFELQRKQTENL